MKNLLILLAFATLTGCTATVTPNIPPATTVIEKNSTTVVPAPASTTTVKVNVPATPR